MKTMRRPICGGRQITSAPLARSIIRKFPTRPQFAYRQHRAPRCTASAARTAECGAHRQSPPPPLLVYLTHEPSYASAIGAIGLDAQFRKNFGHFTRYQQVRNVRQPISGQATSALQSNAIAPELSPARARGPLTPNF